METATLPTLGQLKLRMTLTVSLVTVATTGFIVLFLAPTLELDPEELRFFAWEAILALLVLNLDGQLDIAWANQLGNTVGLVLSEV